MILRNDRNTFSRSFIGDDVLARLDSASTSIRSDSSCNVSPLALHYGQRKVRLRRVSAISLIKNELDNLSILLVTAKRNWQSASGTADKRSVLKYSAAKSRWPGPSRIDEKHATSEHCDCMRDSIPNDVTSRS